MTIATSWGLNRLEGPANYQTTQQLIHILVDNVAFGGVLVLNVGPAADGSIIPLQEERLLEMGQWLKVNGEAIYYTKPWSVAQHVLASVAGAEVFYTESKTGGVVFAIMTGWPETNKLKLSDVHAKPETKMAMLAGANGTQPLPLRFSAARAGVTVELPVLTVGQLPCEHAWAIRIEGL